MGLFHATSELDNALVHQKNCIINLINADFLDEAYIHLIFNKELWEACDYLYKYNELIARLKTVGYDFGNSCTAAQSVGGLSE